MDGRPRILIVGGGYGGMHTALRLERLLHPGEATVTVADSRSYMTYQPLLAEAAAGKPAKPAGKFPSEIGNVALKHRRPTFVELIFERRDDPRMIVAYVMDAIS